MIRSKSEYKEYYLCDLRKTGIINKKWYNRLTDRRFKFYKALRFTEYYNNCKNKWYHKIPKKIINMRYARLCDKYNWTIPINVFDKGLTIVHVGTIVVSGRAKIGKNCRIHVCTNIGSSSVKGVDGAPVIGDNVYIGPGAKIFGPISIGSNVAIGANAVVNKSFPDNCTIAGVPAKKISDNTSSLYIGDDYEN